MQQLPHRSSTVPAIADETSAVRRSVCISLSNIMASVRMVLFLQRDLSDGPIPRENQVRFSK